MRRRLPVGSSNVGSGSCGFVLIDALAALAITALALSLVWPAVMQRTTAPRLAAISEEITTFLMMSRTRALQSGEEALTLVDARRRTVITGGRVLTLPADVDLSVLSADSCQLAGSSVGIVFRPDGTSCGAVVRLAHGAMSYRIRVNWYTGHIAILKT